MDVGVEEGRRKRAAGEIVKVTPVLFQRRAEKIMCVCLLGALGRVQLANVKRWGLLGPIPTF